MLREQQGAICHLNIWLVPVEIVSLLPAVCLDSHPLSVQSHCLFTSFPFPFVVHENPPLAPFPPPLPCQVRQEMYRYEELIKRRWRESVMHRAQVEELLTGVGAQRPPVRAIKTAVQAVGARGKEVWECVWISQCDTASVIQHKTTMAWRSANHLVWGQEPPGWV